MVSLAGIRCYISLDHGCNKHCDLIGQAVVMVTNCDRHLYDSDRHLAIHDSDRHLTIHDFDRHL